MEYLVIVGSSIGSLLLFVLPDIVKTRFNIFIHVILSLSGISLAFRVLGSGNSVVFYSGFAGFPVMTIDSLSAFFLLLISFSALAISFYVQRTLRFSDQRANKLRMTLHLFAMIWLHISMILLCASFTGINFLLVWELMSVTSFVMVLWGGRKRESRAVAMTFIVQLQLILVLLRFGFLIFSTPIFDRNSKVVQFDALQVTFTGAKNHAQLYGFS